jgi:hypothetical protein
MITVLEEPVELPSLILQSLLFYQSNSKHFPKPASPRFRLSVGLGPKKKHLFQETYPLYGTFQNQNRANVVRQESAGEVNKGKSKD